MVTLEDRDHDPCGRRNEKAGHATRGCWIPWGQARVKESRLPLQPASPNSCKPLGTSFKTFLIFFFPLPLPCVSPHSLTSSSSSSHPLFSSHYPKSFS